MATKTQRRRLEAEWVFADQELMITETDWEYPDSGGTRMDRHTISMKLEELEHLAVLVEEVRGQIAKTKGNDTHSALAAQKEDNDLF